MVFRPRGHAASSSRFQCRIASEVLSIENAACESCLVMLAALLCTENGFTECDYKAPKAGVCKCT